MDKISVLDVGDLVLSYWEDGSAGCLPPALWQIGIVMGCALPPIKLHSKNGKMCPRKNFAKNFTQKLEQSP